MRLRFLTALAGLCMLAFTPILADETIDFEALAAGMIVSEVSSVGGAGPISVYAELGSDPGVNRAVIFDSSNPTGGDDDLGSPNWTCDTPGPGVGIAGEMGQPTENCVALGNLLIIQENLTATDTANGFVADPDDADEVGAYMELDFSALGGVQLKELVLLDVESDIEPDAKIELFGAGDALLLTINESTVGDNGKKLIGLGPTDGVYKMHITLNGSGAVDNVIFVVDQPECGDGIVDEGEECDDGNDINDDDCRNDCTLPECGDGIVDEGEECDDGNDINDDDCRNDCTLPECGDGIVDEGEECDDGNDINDDDCRNDCTLPECGDGIVDEGEECDDGNDINDDDCRNDCTLPECGDGIVDEGEECDDGNDINDDDCRNDCTLPECGDGIVDEGEECDDGNDINDDDCRNDCTLPECGDGIVDEGEECDDGNDIDDDGCSNACTIPQGFAGCTPGFWKNNVGQWTPTPYNPGQSLNGVFSEASAYFPNSLTLLQALHFGGGPGALGGAKNLLRAAVAGLLNASHPGVDYAGSDAASLIAAVNAALASGDRATMLALAGSIDFDNNAGCSLDADESNKNRLLPGTRVPTRFNAPSTSTSGGTVDFGRR